MRSILIFVLAVQFSLLSAGQKVHLDNDKYIGEYRIIYFSDSFAYNNLVTEYNIHYNERNGSCDSCELLYITDTSFVFEIEEAYGDTNYKYWNRKKKGNRINISFYPRLNPLLSSVPGWPAKRYQIKFIPITGNALGIHFKNLKTKEDNLMNESDVKYRKAEPRYHTDYYQDIYIIVIRINN